MTREEYIESAVAEIKDKQAKAEIAAEIAAHLDDRIKFYTDAGYDYDSALSQAIGRMGDGEAVSHSMSRLYKSNFGIVSTAYGFMACGVITTALSVFAAWDEYSFDSLMRIGLYAAFILLYVITTAVKNSDKKLILYGLLYQTFVIATKAIMIIHMGVKAALTSTFLIFIASLMSGDMQAVKTVVSSDIEIIPPDILFIISITLYLSVYGIIIAVLRFTKKTSNTHYTLRQKHIKEYTFRACIGLMLAVLVVYIGFAASDMAGIKDGYTERDRIIIAESDSPVDFSGEMTNEKLSDVAYEDNAKLKVNGKAVFLSTFAARNDTDDYYEYYYIDTVGGKNTSSYMTEGKIGNIKYKIKNNVLEYTPSQKYVYVFSMPSDPESAKYSFKKEYKNSSWVKTDNESKFSFPVEQGRYPVNVNHIKIEKRN